MPNILASLPPFTFDVSAIVAAFYVSTKYKQKKKCRACSTKQEYIWLLAGSNFQLAVILYHTYSEQNINRNALTLFVFFLFFFHNLMVNSWCISQLLIRLNSLASGCMRSSFIRRLFVASWRQHTASYTQLVRQQQNKLSQLSNKTGPNQKQIMAECCSSDVFGENHTAQALSSVPSLSC